MRPNRIEAAKSVASQTRKANTMSNSTTKKPTYRIYSVFKPEGKKAIWQEIGAAWSHDDGLGFNLSFGARPLAGADIVLRVPKAEEDATV
jgi:hypothetical protein